MLCAVSKMYIFLVDLGGFLNFARIGVYGRFRIALLTFNDI